MPFLVGLAIKALNIWRWIKLALASAFEWAKVHPWPAACIALLLFIAWQNHFIRGRDTIIATKDRIISAQARQIDAMKRASEANRQAQLAQKALYEARYRVIAHDADTKHAQDMAVANDRLRRYIDAHRLRDQGNPGGLNPGSASEGRSAQGVAGPRLSPDLVAVSAEDLQICTDNTVRLQAGHDWAMKLIEANGR